MNLGVGHELNRKCNAFNTAPKKIDVSNEAGCFWSFLFCFFLFALLLKYHDSKNQKLGKTRDNKQCEILHWSTFEGNIVLRKADNLLIRRT